jgi:hypothetical protein
MAVSVTQAGIQQGNIIITTDGLPDPALYGTPLGSGLFPGTTNVVSDHGQTIYTLPYRAGQAVPSNFPDAAPVAVGAVVGVTLTGVKILTASISGPLPGSIVNPPTGFVHNAVFAEDSLAVDICGGVPLINGDYVYRSGSFLVNCWGSKVIASNTYFSSSNYRSDYFRHSDGHSKIIGISFDGYPIYGPFGYSLQSDPRSEPTRMTSSYRPIPSPKLGRVYSYSQKQLGTYIQDFEYVENIGTLDQYNGRFTKTPDFPNGTYAYFMTFDVQNRPVYPYIIGPSFASTIGSASHDHP